MQWRTLTEEWKYDTMFIFIVLQMTWVLAENWNSDWNAEADGFALTIPDRLARNFQWLWVTPFSCTMV